MSDLFSVMYHFESLSQADQVKMLYELDDYAISAELEKRILAWHVMANIGVKYWYRPILDRILIITELYQNAEDITDVILKRDREKISLIWDEEEFSRLKSEAAIIRRMIATYISREQEKRGVKEIETIIDVENRKRKEKVKRTTLDDFFEDYEKTGGITKKLGFAPRPLMKKPIIPIIDDDAPQQNVIKSIDVGKISIATKKDNDVIGKSVSFKKP